MSFFSSKSEALSASKDNLKFQVTNFKDISGKNRLTMNALNTNDYIKWMSAIKQAISNLDEGMYADRDDISDFTNDSACASNSPSNLHAGRLSSLFGSVPSSHVIAPNRRSLRAIPAYVMKCKVGLDKVFINVFTNDTIPLSVAILGSDCPHAVADREGKVSDAYDVCINSASKSDVFNKQVGDKTLQECPMVECFCNVILQSLFLQISIFWSCDFFCRLSST
jgi:hypothetical protein